MDDSIWKPNLVRQKLLGARRSQPIPGSPSHSDSMNSNAGAISPQTLGLKERVRFIDHGDDGSVDDFSILGVPESGFQNPAFQELDQQRQCLLDQDKCEKMHDRSFMTMTNVANSVRF